MEPLFVVAKIIGSPGKKDSQRYIQTCFKCDCDHSSTVAFGNARITPGRKNVFCLEIGYLNVVGNLGVILVLY